MKCSAQRKCQHCKEFYLPDRRNLHHQRYCSEAACRRRSKAESQRRWAQKPDNQNYFSGPQNCQRAKEWRKRNPGYWRKKSPPSQEPLQDLYTTQVAQDEQVKRRVGAPEQFDRTHVTQNWTRPLEATSSRTSRLVSRCSPTKPCRPGRKRKLRFGTPCNAPRQPLPHSRRPPKGRSRTGCAPGLMC